MGRKYYKSLKSYQTVIINHFKKFDTIKNTDPNLARYYIKEIQKFFDEVDSIKSKVNINQPEIIELYKGFDLLTVQFEKCKQSITEQH